MCTLGVSSNGSPRHFDETFALSSDVTGGSVKLGGVKNEEQRNMIPYDTSITVAFVILIFILTITIVIIVLVTKSCRRQPWMQVRNALPTTFLCCSAALNTFLFGEQETT